MKTGKWNNFGCCPCGWAIRLPFGDMVFVTARRKVCPECGNDIHLLRQVARRWNSEAIWWQPWTWRRGSWEDKAGQP